MAMAADRICAAGESYLGLVEVGVGLLPAGGGCRELLRRVVTPAMKRADSDPLPFLGKVFENIAMAKVSASALQAQEMGFLTDCDRIIMKGEHVLAEAKREVLALAAAGYAPPPRTKSDLCPGTAGDRRPDHHGPVHALGGVHLRLRYVYRQEDRLCSFRR